MPEAYCVFCNEPVKTKMGGESGTERVAIEHPPAGGVGRCDGSGDSVLHCKRQPRAEAAIYLN
jgi:hypothetical protein